MSSSSFDQDKELAEFFTDVEHLREAFKNAVAAPTLTKRLFVIHGVGGVGKSSLLRMFRLHCRSVNVPVALASGDEAKSAFDILARWTADLKVDGVSFSAFSKTFAHYREIQAKVDAQAKKAGGRAADIGGKAASKTAEAAGGALAGAAIGSMIPGVGTAIGGALGGVLGGMGAEALTDWLRGFLKQPDIDLLLDPAKKLTDDFLNDITKVADKRRSVLMLDTFEQMTALEDWTRDVAQRLHPNVLFVIAGRALPNWSRAWDSWQKRAYIEELKPMTEDVMRELIQRYYATMRGGEPAPAQVEAIIRFARGLPMVVTSAVQLWVKYGVEDFQSVKTEIVANLVDRMTEGVPSALLPALEAAAIVRWFDQPILRAVLQQDDVRDAYNELRRFPFVRVRVEGLALHDAVREIMDENLCAQDSERHREMHERAATYFEKRLEKATGEEAERLGLERLYHRVRADEVTGIKLFQETAEELVRSRLISRLRALLNNVRIDLLEQENSKLWVEYYSARLLHLEAQRADAEKAYQSIYENNNAETRLRAYALCDWGSILERTAWLSKPGGTEKATNVLERALTILSNEDPKTVSALLSLCGVYTRLGDYEHAIYYGKKAIEFSEIRQDSYALILALESLRWIYVLSGDWQSMLANQAAGEKLLTSHGKSPYLLARVIGSFTIGCSWAGNYSESERRSIIALGAFEELSAPATLSYLRELAYAEGMQDKYEKADENFGKALQVANLLGYQREKVTLSFWGRILIRQGAVEKARNLLIESYNSGQELKDPGVMIESLNWLAEVAEIAHDWLDAETQYNRALELRRTRRYYFECGALTGFVRVKHAQDDFAAIPPLLAEAEQLAQQYEYNDHLASLRLTQGHIAWEGKAPTWDNGFEAALHLYQHALIYALRYNRFLLDEVLSGRSQGTPLRPIIPHCLKRGEEGRQMLIALRDWWQAGVNDIGTPRPDTISPIPEGIPLLEAEHIAREREPGDGSPQKSVIEQIEVALGYSVI